MNRTRYMKTGGLPLVAVSLLLALGLQVPVQAQVDQQDAAQTAEGREGRFLRGGFGRGGPAAGMRGPRGGAPLLEHFDTMDINDDSLLSQEELLAGPRQRIEGLFACLDTDADGFLARDELEARQGGGREAASELRACMQEP